MANDHAEPVVVALRAEHVARRFGSVEALQDVSFEVRKGELYGLVGPDGAGKTTAIRALSGLLLPDRGSCEVFGRSPEQTGARERLGLMPQQYSLYRDLTVEENLSFFGQLYALSAAQFAERSARLLAITRLGPFRRRRADALSGGMYKKLALSCALLHEPDALLLDEPTNGVDPVSRRELWDLLHEFTGRGMAILVSTPYMDEAERCHRVGLLHRGRLLLEGEPGGLLRRFDGESHEVEGGDRREVERALRRCSEVHAASPAGSRLRLVIEAGTGDLVGEIAARHGARLRRVPPNFEDLYLARLRRAHLEHAGRAAESTREPS